MIKNILYSLFIHFLLFSAIYFAFVKKDQKEIETEQEVLVSVISIDSKGVPPINEQMEKPDKIEEKPPEKIEEKKEEIKDSEVPKEIIPKNKKKEKIKPKTPKKIAENSKKDEVKTPNEQTEETSKSKPSDKKDEVKDFFKVMNLKAFKNVTEDEKGSTLSIRETINIQSQLKLCYKRALEESGFESKTKIVIRIEISQDGYIQNDLDEMVDLEKYNNPIHKDYKIVIDNIKRALDLCSPLRNLPIEKYDSWKEIILQFDVGKDSD
jgi:outer membrane biosynthesis protein TonB